MNFFKIVALFTITYFLTNPSYCNNSAFKPVNLRCENLDNPIGIETQNPRLSWIIEHSGVNI
jgi:hypothetical protein